MGRTNIYSSTRKVWVTPFDGCLIEYGFPTKIDTVESSELGHKDLTTAVIPIFGISSPKPAEYRKVAAGYSITSFKDAAMNLANTPWKKAKKGGFRKIATSTAPTPGMGRRPVKCTLSVTLAIDYAWMMDARLYDNIAQFRSALGIDDIIGTDAELKNLIWGCDKNQQPPKAHYTDPLSGNTYSTFYSPTINNLPAGWMSSGLKDQGE